MVNVAPDNTTSAAAPVERRSELAHELDSPPWLRVESTLMAAADAIRDSYDEVLAPLGLSLSTASLLCYITDFGPLPQTRVAEHLRQGRAATGVQVDRLQQMGLVERQPDAADRRVWLIAVTDAGRQVAAEVAARDEVLRSQLRHGIDRAERQQLASLLVRLRNNLTQADLALVTSSLRRAESPAQSPKQGSTS